MTGCLTTLGGYVGPRVFRGLIEDSCEAMAVGFVGELLLALREMGVGILLALFVDGFRVSVACRRFPVGLSGIRLVAGARSEQVVLRGRGLRGGQRGGFTWLSGPSMTTSVSGKPMSASC